MKEKTMNPRQLILLALLLAGGGAAAFYILGRPEGGGAEHGEHGGHEGEGGEEHGHKKGHDDHGDADKHGGEEGHDGHGDHEGEEAEGHGEGRIHMEDGELAANGIVLDTAQPRRMAVNLSLRGRVVPNEERLAHVHPRFPGLIREVRKQLGEKVQKGEVLAVVESNESMQPYSILSQIDGIVIRKHATAGETATGGEELFTVADLSTVWVDFQVYRQDFPRLRRGQKVRVAADGSKPVEATLTYLAPVSEEHTQSLLVRAVVDNRDGAWPPGLFVQGDVAVETYQAPLAVKLGAVQKLEGVPAVFVREGHEFEARPVSLGRRDGDWVEVLGGLAAGDAYAAGNSFLLKADLGKGEAGHEH